MVLAACRTFTIPASTSSGNQVLATSIDGYTPKAVVIEMSGAPSTGSNANHARIGMGMSDGTNFNSFSSRSRDNRSTASDSGYRRGRQMMEWINSGNNNANGIASFVSFGTDKVTINWSNPPGNTNRLMVTVFYGDLLQAFVGRLDCSATAGTPTSITSAGFRPNLAMVWSPQNGFPPTTVAGNDWYWHHGIACVNEDSVIEQWCYASRERDGLNVQTGMGRIMRNDAVLSHLTIGSTGTPTFTGDVELVSFDSGGITIEPTASGMAFGASWLLLDVGANRMACVAADLDTNTSGLGAGKKVTTGWKPQAGRIVASNVTVV